MGVFKLISKSRELSQIQNVISSLVQEQKGFFWSFNQTKLPERFHHHFLLNYHGDWLVWRVFLEARQIPWDPCSFLDRPYLLAHRRICYLIHHSDSVTGCGLAVVVVEIVWIPAHLVKGLMNLVGGFSVCYEKPTKACSIRHRTLKERMTHCVCARARAEAQTAIKYILPLLPMVLLP